MDKELQLRDQSKVLKQKYEMSFPDLVSAAARILQTADGREKYITKREMFLQIFGDPTKYRVIDIFKISRDFNRVFRYLRRKSDCTVVSDVFIKDEQRVRGFYMATNHEELQPYLDILKKNIKGSEYMMGRMQQKVEDKAYLNFQNKLCLE